MAIYLGTQEINATTSNYATKQWVQSQGYITDASITGGVTKAYVDGQISAVNTSVNTALGNKITKNSLGTINGQSIENGNNVTIDLSLYKIVSQLPTQDINPDKIYLLPNPDGSTGNTYIEYMYVNNVWEKVGEYKMDISLDEYLKKTEAASTYATKTELDDYVKTENLTRDVSNAGFAKKTDLPENLSDLVNDLGFRKVVLLTEAEYAALVNGGGVEENTVYMTY